MAYTDIDDPSAYFQTLLYTGDGNDNRNLVNTGNSDLQPDWIWNKRRDSASNHFIFDSIRGASNIIVADTNEAESANTNQLQAFQTNGFQLGSDNGSNGSNRTMVAWQWKAGTSVSGNSTGSGTAKAYTGSVSTASGFSIIRYVGNGTAGHTIPHHLGKKPDAILIKHLGDGQQWASQWSPLGATKVMRFATANAVSDSNTRWNDTEPTSSVFTLGTEHEGNTNDGNHIAYCFTNIQGYSKVGSYVGNGNANGTFVYTGFKPRWIMIKGTNIARNWGINDTKRSPINQTQDSLYANVSDAETGSGNYIDFLSNGFKLRDSALTMNGAYNYIYMAFAENPFVTSTGVPATAR